jgi:hypothetical protein
VTERDPLQCDACRDMITDLACGELNSRDETKVRAHAEHCDACSKALLGFQQVIWAASEAPLVDPSEGLDARIMAAAEAALQQRRAKGGSGSGAGAARSPVKRTGGWLTSPQLAMAAVALVVVGLAIHALRSDEPEHAALAPATAPPAETTGAPKPTATGAIAPLPVPDSQPELAEAKRAAAGAGEKEERARATARSAAPTGSAGTGSALAGPLERPAETVAFPSSAKNAADAVAPPVAVVRKRSAGAASVAAEAPLAAAASDDSSRGHAELEGLTPQQLPSKSAEPPAVIQTPAPSPRAAETAAARAAVPPESPSASVAPAAAPRPTTERADLSRGIQALSAGKIQQAIVILFPLARSGSDEVRDLAQTLLAEALHDAGRCQDAIAWFNRVVARPSASRKSLELAADCYAKTGKDAKAEELRKRAQGR